MNCTETKNNIEALIDGELEFEIINVTEQHLRICADCRESREELTALSELFQVSQIEPPSGALDKQVMKSFASRHTPPLPFWRRIIFGSLYVPVPALATLLFLALAGCWLAFQFGRVNSPVILQMPSMTVMSEVTLPAAANTKIVRAEVPVVKEKLLVRTIYLPAKRNEQMSKSLMPAVKKRGSGHPSSFGSTIADVNNVSDRLSLKGFRPPPAISARIIKEVTPGEK